MYSNEIKKKKSPCRSDSMNVCVCRASFRTWSSPSCATQTAIRSCGRRIPTSTFAWSSVRVSNELRVLYGLVIANQATGKRKLFTVCLFFNFFFIIYMMFFFFIAFAQTCSRTSSRPRRPLRPCSSPPVTKGKKWVLTKCHLALQGLWLFGLTSICVGLTANMLMYLISTLLFV